MYHRMKKVIVRINDNYSIDSATTEILKLYGYLSFVEQFRSFQIITFDCPAAYQGNLLTQLKALNVVKNATWDVVAYETTPMPTLSSLTVKTSGSTTINTPASGQATSNTRSLTTTGSGTIYVKVQNIGGSNFYVFSQTQGGTYTFDQSDATNTNHPLRFSETQAVSYTHLTLPTKRIV